MTDDPAPLTPPLSPAGRRRSEAILREAVAAGRRRAVRRRLRHAALVACVPLAMVLNIALNWQPDVRGPNVVVTTRPNPTPSPTPSLESGPTSAPASPRTTYRLVRSIEADPDILSRYVRPSRAPAIVRRIDDNELLRALADAGFKGGLATVGDRARLLVSQK